MHSARGMVVAVSGMASGVLVVAVNAWMNTPSGVRFEGGRIVDVDLWQAFFSPAFPTQAVHMVLAAYDSVAIAALGIHSWRLRADRERAFHRAGAKIAFVVAAVTLPLSRS